MKSTLDALAVVLTIAALASCAESPRWGFRNAGVHQVRVYELTVPDTIASDEVLSIQFFGDTWINGQPTLSRIDAVRQSAEIELTVWAEVEVWIGSGPAPPYPVSISAEYQAQPPFDPGESARLYRRLWCVLPTSKAGHTKIATRSPKVAIAPIARPIAIANAEDFGLALPSFRAIWSDSLLLWSHP